VDNNEDEEDKKALLESKEQVTTGKKKLYYVWGWKGVPVMSVKFVVYCLLNVCIVLPILLTAIAPMIQSARAAITNTGNEQAQVEFAQKSDNVSIE